MKRSWVEHVMGMPASLLLRGEVIDGVDSVVEAMYAELRRIDAVFSTYLGDSEISALRSGRLEVADASDDVRDVLALCERARQQTQGWFDVRLPGGLDPSGLVKGWAIERAMAVLDDLSGVDVCLNLGGDVAVRVAASGAPFHAGIEDPHARGRLVTTLALTGGGLATSGTAARGLHIVDPHSGRPVAQLASVSVIGPSPMWADVLATAAFARGRSGLQWLSAVPAYEALVVHLDGTVERSPGWPTA